MTTKQKIALSIAVATFILFLAWLFWPQHESLEITGFSWDRNIRIQQYNTVQETSHFVPSPGRQLKTWVELETSFDTDGNLQFDSERYYLYEIERWQNHSVLVTAGENQTNPEWPAATLSKSNKPYGAGKQRENGRWAHYVVHLKDSSGKYRKTYCEQDAWESLGVGQMVYATTTRWGGIWTISTLESN